MSEDKIYPSMVIRIQAEAIELLEQENKQLKEKINTYENPEDMTLMYMWCDEKAKDKIKQLKEVIEEVRERSKLERKTALSLNQHYAVSIIDSVLQILDKVKENK